MLQFKFTPLIYVKRINLNIQQARVPIYSTAFNFILIIANVFNLYQFNQFKFQLYRLTLALG